MKARSLMIIHQFRPVANGAELQAERLACKLVERGHGVRVLTRMIDYRSKKDEVIRGVEVHRSSSTLPYQIDSRAAPLFRYLAKNRHSYDIIHSHQCFNHAVVAALTAWWLRKKSILKIACTGEAGDLCVFSKNRGFHRALKVLHRTDAVVAVSNGVIKELLGYGFPQKRIHYIPNGVDTNYFKRSKPFPDNQVTRFILVGRRTPQKGIDIALQALRTLKEKGLEKKVSLEFYGPDCREYAYEEMARTLGVSSMCSFLPYSDPIIDIYHSSHCLILPSRQEGLANVLLEAMAMEMPVIASQIDGTTDVVSQGQNGILVPPEDHLALAGAMEFVLENREAAYFMGRNARDRVRQGFSLDNVAQCYSVLYDSLISGNENE